MEVATSGEPRTAAQTPPTQPRCIHLLQSPSHSRASSWFSTIALEHTAHSTVEVVPTLTAVLVVAASRFSGLVFGVIAVFCVVERG